jgi:hypothetical protein
MTIHIANLIIEQNTNGLYSINDLHKASGGLKKHQPDKWFQLQSTTNFVRYQESNEKSQGLNQGITQESSVMVTVKGNSPNITQGTFVSRKLVVAYAMWISPEFADHVLTVFLDVVDGAYQRIADQDRIIEQKTLQLDLFTGELASMRKRDPRGKQTLPVVTGIEARNCKAKFDQLVKHGYLTASEYYPERMQYKPTQKALDAGIIAGIKNRTVLFNDGVLDVLEELA